MRSHFWKELINWAIALKAAAKPIASAPFFSNYLPVISIRKIPATNSIPPTPLIKGGKGGSLIPKFKGNDITVPNT
jgi:hypothetical protein